MENEHVERTLKLWATSDTTTTLHYCFGIWSTEAKDARKQMEIEAAEDRMRQMHNAEYERALKSWVSTNDKSHVHYVFSMWHGALREAHRQQKIEAAQAR